MLKPLYLKEKQNLNFFFNQLINKIKILMKIE